MKSRGVTAPGVSVWLMLPAVAVLLAARATGPWWGRSIETVSGRKVVAVAIRYKR